MRKLILSLCLLCVNIFAAADYNFNASGVPFQVITVTTAATINVTISDDDITIVHLNIQNDGSTASAATDKLYIMRNQDAAGTAVTMAATTADGVKAFINPGGSITFPGKHVPIGADGARELQLRATGNGAKVLIIRGRNLKSE